MYLCLILLYTKICINIFTVDFIEFPDKLLVLYVYIYYLFTIYVYDKLSALYLFEE